MSDIGFQPPNRQIWDRTQQIVMEELKLSMKNLGAKKKIQQATQPLKALKSTRRKDHGNPETLPTFLINPSLVRLNVTLLGFKNPPWRCRCLPPCGSSPWLDAKCCGWTPVKLNGSMRASRWRMSRSAFVWRNDCKVEILDANHEFYLIIFFCVVYQVVVCWRLSLAFVANMFFQYSQLSNEKETCLSIF